MAAPSAHTTCPRHGQKLVRASTITRYHRGPADTHGCWWWGTSGDTLTPVIKCAACGGNVSIGNLTIDDRGVVLPAGSCPHCKHTTCIELADWRLN